MVTNNLNISSLYGPDGYSQGIVVDSCSRRKRPPVVRAVVVTALAYITFSQDMPIVRSFTKRSFDLEAQKMREMCEGKAKKTADSAQSTQYRD